METLGLHAKSPFSYTDVFTVETIISHPSVGNIKYIYSCFIDSTGVGKVSCLSESLTKEGTGTKVSFGVRQQDQRSFHKEMNYYLSYMDFTTNAGDLKPSYTYTSADWPKAGWAVLEEYTHKSCVLVGRIPYPLSDSPIDFKGLHWNLIDKGIVLKGEIGEVTLPYSRESLHYDDRTTRWVEERIKKAAEELVAMINKGLEDCSSYSEAATYYAKINYKFTSHCTKFWRGYDVSNPRIYLGHSYSSHCKIINLKDYVTVKSKKDNVISLSRARTAYIFQDIPTPKGLDSRWKLFKDKYDYIYYLGGDDCPKWSDWTSANKNLELAGFVNLSDIMDELNELHAQAKEEARLARIAAAVPGAPKAPSAKGMITIRRVTPTSHGHGNIYSIPEEPIDKATLIASNPIIVKVVGYINTTSGLENNIDVGTLLNAIATLGVSEIVAVKSADYHKVDSLRNVSDILATHLDSECMSTFGVTLEKLIEDVACFEAVVDRTRNVDYYNKKLSTTTLSNIAWSLSNYTEIMKLVGGTDEFPELNVFVKQVELQREKFALAKKLKLMSKVNQFVIPDDVQTSIELRYAKLLAETELLVDKYRLIFTYLLQLGSSSEGLLVEEIRTYINYINN